MQRWMNKIRPLACGGVTLGILQAVPAIDFNQIWVQFLATWINVLVSLLFGGDLSNLTGGGSFSPFGSFFA